jgi:hypothetical protein
VMAAIPQVVVLDDFLDAHKAFLGRLDFFNQLPKIAVCLAPAAGNLVVVVAVSWDELDDDLVGDEIFPVSAGYGAAVAEHQLGAVEVTAALFQKVLDGVMLECLDRLGGRRHDLCHGRVRATSTTTSSGAM